MAHSHENIEYGINEVKEVFNAAIMTGTIVSVDVATDKADVNISGLGTIDDVPVFYHCPGESSVAGGAMAFADGDSVYILNKEGKVTPQAIDLQIVGFVDGLKLCAFYIDIKVNNIVPTHLQTVKIVDSEDTEEILNNTAEDRGRVGPFVTSFVYPIKIYLYAGSHRSVFSYYITPGDGNLFLCRKVSGTGDNHHALYESASFDATADYCLSVKKVEYVKETGSPGGNFDSPPEGFVYFTAKMLKKTRVQKYAFNDFKNCTECGPLADVPSFTYALFTEGNFGSTTVYNNWGDPTLCQTCLSGSYSYKMYHESWSGDMCILLDADEKTPTYNLGTETMKGMNLNVSISIGELCSCPGEWIHGDDCCCLTGGQVCSLTGEFLEAEVWEWQMVDTPAICI